MQLTSSRLQGVAPTVIIVRALQGKTTDSVNQVVSANNHDRGVTTTRSGIRFAPARGDGGVTTATGGQITQLTVDLPGHGHSTSNVSSGDSEKMEGTQGGKGQV